MIVLYLLFNVLYLTLLKNPRMTKICVKRNFLRKLPSKQKFKKPCKIPELFVTVLLQSASLLLPVWTNYTKITVPKLNDQQSRLTDRCHSYRTDRTAASTIVSVPPSLVLTQRRRINTDEKTKVVAVVWGTNFVFLFSFAALAIVYLDVLKNRMNLSFCYKSSWCNSSHSSNPPIVHNSWCGKE